MSLSDLINGHKDREITINHDAEQELLFRWFNAEGLYTGVAMSMLYLVYIHARYGFHYISPEAFLGKPEIENYPPHPMEGKQCLELAIFVWWHVRHRYEQRLLPQVSRCDEVDNRAVHEILGTGADDPRHPKHTSPLRLLAKTHWLEGDEPPRPSEEQLSRYPDLFDWWMSRVYRAVK